MKLNPKHSKTTKKINAITFFSDKPENISLCKNCLFVYPNCNAKPIFDLNKKRKTSKNKLVIVRCEKHESKNVIFSGTYFPSITRWNNYERKEYS